MTTMTSSTPDLMRPETGNPYPKYRGVVYIMGFRIDQDPHHIRQFFADHVGPCEIHSCSRSNKAKRRGLYLSLEFKYEEDAQRTMAVYQNRLVRGSKPLCILWYCGSKDRDSRNYTGSSLHRPPPRDCDDIDMSGQLPLKRRRINPDTDRYRNEGRYSGYASHRGRETLSASTSRSTSVTRSPHIRSSYGSYDYGGRERSHTPSHGGALMSGDARMDPMSSHTQLDSYPSYSIDETVPCHSMVESMPSYEVVESAPSHRMMDSLTGNEGVACSEEFGDVNESDDLRLMLSGGIPSSWMDERQESETGKNVVMPEADLENQSTETSQPALKKGGIAFKIKSHRKSPLVGTSEFQHEEQQAAAQEHFEQDALRFKDSIQGEQTNQNNENHLGRFIPIQSYEGHELLPREPLMMKGSFALHDPQNKETVDASTQHVISEQEQPSMDISPVDSENEAVDCNQELLYENEDDDTTRKHIPFEAALSAVLKRRAKLEMAFQSDCTLLAQSVEIFSRYCPKERTLLLSVLRSTLQHLSQRVTKKLEQYADSLVTKTRVDGSET